MGTREETSVERAEGQGATGVGGEGEKGRMNGMDEGKSGKGLDQEINLKPRADRMNRHREDERRQEGGGREREKRQSGKG